MVRTIAFPLGALSLLLSAVACGGPDDELRGWKESDVEIVSEGAATGTTSRIVTPGHAPGGGAPALTSTDIDTTGLLEAVPQDELSYGADEGGGTLADRLGVASQPDATSPGALTAHPAPSPQPAGTARTTAPATPSTSASTPTAGTTTRTPAPPPVQRPPDRAEPSGREESPDTESERPSRPADSPADAPPEPEPSEPPPRRDPPPETEDDPPPDEGSAERVVL
jgi:hypothetical protein